MADGRHFHHYNIGIALLAAIGAIALRGEERHRKHPLTATAYGAANALIVDELMLLLDLKDVYWAKDGRTSVEPPSGSSASVECSWPPYPSCNGRCARSPT